MDKKVHERLLFNFPKFQINISSYADMSYYEKLEEI